MKMKKILLVISMLAVMFSLAGCEDEKEKPFEYNESQIVLDVMYLFDEYTGISDNYVDYYLTDGTEFEKSAVKGVQQVIDTDKVGKFEDYGKYLNGEVNYEYKKDDGISTITNEDDYVSVSVINKAADRDVNITVKFVENADYFIQYEKLAQEINVASISSEINNYYGYTVEEFLSMTGYESVDQIVAETIETNLASNEVFRYIPEEMVINAVYTTGELMKQAATNTLIGMGTVFIVLIFISFIISLFKFLPALFAKKTTVPESSEMAKSEVIPSAATNTTEVNLMNDAELVAVITAAIYAESGSLGASINGADSKDKLIVRSIRRAKK